MNLLSVASIIALVCSLFLPILVVGRFFAHYFSGSHNPSFKSFCNSKGPILFGAFERRVLGLSFAQCLCAILNLIVSSALGQVECNDEMYGTSVLPILLWLETVGLPVCHLVFFVPSIVESFHHATQSRFVGSASHHHDDDPDHVNIKQLLLFAAKLLLFLGITAVAWLPVFILYINDSTVSTSCFSPSNSLIWYMESSIAIAGSTVMCLLIALLILSSFGSYGYIRMHRLSNRNAGYIFAAYAFIAVAVIFTALCLPELLYRAVNLNNDTRLPVPTSFKLVTIIALPLHCFLLCIVTGLAFMFIAPSELAFNVRITDANNDIDARQGRFSLSFYASPRYEDRYASGVMGQASKHYHHESAESIINEKPIYDDVLFQDDEFLQVPTSPYLVNAYNASLDHTPSMVEAPKKIKSRFNFI
ncbi:hypothetical protein V1514DRAFT_652 [Lipomyces japonicus]|uniref:uncharacterized protein n=1 Tax=Lipomyces japonicus TaxID=56871 RepID=UPI0034CD669E